MPKGPAARVSDFVTHPTPPTLGPGPGSPNVLIGGMPAWRGLPASAVGGLRSAKQTSDDAIKKVEQLAVAAAGTPKGPDLRAAAEALKTSQSIAMSAMFTAAAVAAGGADMHQCAVPLPIPPHGPGVVIDGSATVLINGMCACRSGDTVLEPLGPPNKIAQGDSSVIIGD